MALLTQTDKTRIRQMREDGTPVSYIAAAMEMTVEEVEAVLARKEPHEEPKTRTGKKYRTEPISDEVKAEIISMAESGATIAEIKAKTGVSQASISRIKAAMKEKEPAAAATATDSVSSKDENSLAHTNDNTRAPKSQALRGVEVIGLMQTMLIGIEENFGDNVEIMSLRADSDTANIVFRYGGTAYDLSFGLAF
jgi:transposase-like protein